MAGSSQDTNEDKENWQEHWNEERGANLVDDFNTAKYNQAEYNC